MQNNTVNPNFKIIIWAALFFSNLMLIALTLFMSEPQVIPEVTEGGLPQTYIFFIMGVMSLIASFIIPKVIKTPANDPNAQFTKFIIGLVLNESCSMFAFIIAYVNHDHTTGFILFALSTLGYLVRFPKKEDTTMTSGNSSLNVE